MDNKDIVKKLRAVANLMELHDENAFKVRSYTNAIYNIERLNLTLKYLSLSELEKIQGIGKSIAAKVRELIETGSMKVHDEYLAITPEGIIEMLSIKGLGTKKIKTLWQELGITSIAKLRQAIDQNQLLSLKGFGAKMQEKISDTIDYYLRNKSILRFADAEIIARSLLDAIGKSGKGINAGFTGQLRRKLNTIDTISLIAGTTRSDLLLPLLEKTCLMTIDSKKSSPFLIRGTLTDKGTPVCIYLCKPESYQSRLMLTTGSAGHLNYQVDDKPNLWSIANGTNLKNEEEAYRQLNLPYIAPELREHFIEFELASKNRIPRLLVADDLKGIIHNHTTYSDGKHSLTEMAEYCRSLGYEYLGISDHSKATAFYANGLNEDRVKQQQDEIDKLNEKLTPFRIFKGIEADILPDGNIDYEPDTLTTFDFVVASVHSVLNMDVVRATDRVIKAINNPYTTILGHMTGRLLLIREGYPLDHKAVIEACANNGVIIEVNAHPQRLDIDWRWVPYALEKGVLLSINPDAHEKKGYHDMYYGVCAARKGGLTKEMTFNTFSLDTVSEHFRKRKERALTKASV